MTADFSRLAAIRLGYGLSPHLSAPQDPEAVLAGLQTVGPEADAITTDQARRMQQDYAALRKGRRQSDAALAEFKDYQRRMARMLMLDLQDRIARAVDDPVGFGERLVQFWADHFTVRPRVAGDNPLARAFVDEAIRPHVGGRFEDMFLAAETHPMMLLYLNQNSSRGPNSQAARRRPNKGYGLNENLAREAMELHSLGADAPYTQRDVRELAELLTGLSYNARDGFAYRPQIAEPGAETVLGSSYGGRRRGGLDDIRAALTDIARRPEAARFLSHKLAVHFVSDDPPPALVEAMAQTWQETDGDLPQVYRVMITRPELAAGFRQKLRQPLDYVIAGLRALGVTGDQVRALEFPQLPALTFHAMAGMGQRWMSPIGPNGWPEDAPAWIAPQLLANRINWAMRAPGRLVTPLPDPRDFLQTALGGTHSEALAWAVPKAESRAEGVALVLASNDFNRR